jgi:isopentenyl diphosphate isomerase/L-lactate dehydrogenase-like FMN-dependent dehydrogenase
VGRTVTTAEWYVPGDAESLGLRCEQLARASLDRAAYDYVAGGADDETSLRANVESYDRYALRPRVLTGVRESDLAVSVLGSEWAAPLFVAPMGGHCLMHSTGERATATASSLTGVGYVASSAATTALEDVARSARCGPWFQLYWLADREITADLVCRAEAAGYRALCLTVDMPVVGLRRRDLANRYKLPSHLRHVNLSPYQVDDTGDGEVSYFGRLIDGALGWKDLAWLRSRTSMPLILKGVMTAEDALAAISEGVEAVYVSNHGGRQLGRCVSTVEVLPEITNAVGGRVPVLVDGGIRRASDVLVALSLGATAVGLGRPVLWALAAGAQEAVQELLSRFIADLQRLMVLTGTAAIRDLGPELLARV